jgi:restriction system protein
MARRGFFAELQHQSRVAAQDRARAEQVAARRRVAAARQAEQARKTAERTQSVLVRSAEAERKRLEKESRESYVAAREAEVAEKNDDLAQINEEINLLLAGALRVDAYVDLNSLRVEATHPPFNRGDLEILIPMPQWIPDPIEPVIAQIEPPSGLAKLFGKKKYEEAVENAQRIQDEALTNWRSDCQAVRARRQKAVEIHAVAETARLEALKSAREQYANECAARESAAATHNRKLGELIANLGYGTADAIQEYVEIVLSNSAYPEHFQVGFDSNFDPSTAELRLRVLVPGPTTISEVKLFKYAKASDEIVSTALSQKESRDRYADAIHQVALRSFHEVFEADRRGLVKTISLEVGTDTIDPATGQRAYIPFIIGAAERESFTKFDLSAVVPALTLGRLGAAVSKNPHDLVPAERSGVRRS